MPSEEELQELAALLKKNEETISTINTVIGMRTDGPGARFIRYGWAAFFGYVFLTNVVGRARDISGFDTLIQAQLYIVPLLLLKFGAPILHTRTPAILRQRSGFAEVCCPVS